MLSWVKVSSPLNIHLAHYEGPLDLLLDLIRKQQIDIKDIPIATITAQYLQYLDEAREMDIDIGADFVYMAATLIYIKSKDAVAARPGAGEGRRRGGRPAAGIGGASARARALQKRRRDAAAEAADRRERVVESADKDVCRRRIEDPGLNVSLFDLVKAFGEILDRAKNRPIYEVEQADVTVADMIRDLRDQFIEAGPDQPVFILRVFERQRTRRAMIAMFLAVLEMVRMQAVVVTQKDLFGEIALQRHSHFDAVFASGQPTAAIDSVEKDYR